MLLLVVARDGCDACRCDGDDEDDTAKCWGGIDDDDENDDAPWDDDVLAVVSNGGSCTNMRWVVLPLVQYSKCGEVDDDATAL